MFWGEHAFAFSRRVIDACHLCILKVVPEVNGFFVGDGGSVW